MPFSYDKVTISMNDYEVYQTLAGANTYLAALITTPGQAWRDTDNVDDDRRRCLVTATRWLDSVTWQGDKVDSAQALAWPRANITGVDSATIPDQIKFACCELAALLIDDNDIRADQSDPMIKGLGAGSARIDYFRPEGNVQQQTPFPPNVMALISQWLAGNGTTLGALGYGDDYKSKLDGKYDFNHGV